MVSSVSEIEGSRYCDIYDKKILKTKLKALHPTQIFAEMSKTDEKGNTVLHSAVAKQNRVAVELILSRLFKGEQVLIMHKQNLLGMTVLDYALRCKTGVLIKSIMDYIHPDITLNVAETLAQTMRERTLCTEFAVKTFAKTFQVSPSQFAPEISIKFVSEGDDSRLYAFGKSIQVLEGLVKLITTYAEEVHSYKPDLAPEIIGVSEIRSEKAFGYSYQVRIHSMLPVHISRAIGYRSEFWKGGSANCHGAALFSAGIVTQIFEADPEGNLLTTLKASAQRIDHKDMKVGDLIFLKQKALKPTHAFSSIDSHSFVYLNHEYCLSMNGLKQQFHFYPTRFVLNTYGFPKNALEVAQKGEESPSWLSYIEVYRKKQSAPIEPIGPEWKSWEFAL
jgi:hypothetical protein